MTDLADTLRQFNRKERHFLIQNCLGDAATQLSPSFCHKIFETFGGRLREEITKGAWWGTDFHFDWLVGALMWHFAEDESEQTKTRRNAAKLITGSQQDIDLVIASKRDLILIEAKGLTGWSRNQLDAKARRLHGFGADEHGTVHASDPSRSVTLHFALASVGDPPNVDCGSWPQWAKNCNGPYHLQLDAPSEFIWVGRTDASGSDWNMWRSGQSKKRRPRNSTIR